MATHAGTAVFTELSIALDGVGRAAVTAGTAEVAASGRFGPCHTFVSVESLFHVRNVDAIRLRIVRVSHSAGLDAPR